MRTRAAVATQFMLAILAACVRSVSTNVPLPSGITVEAAVAHYVAGPDRRFIRASAELHNRGSAPARIKIGGCPLVIAAYDTRMEPKRLVWNSNQVSRPCPDVRRILELAPGQSAVIADTVSIGRVASEGSSPGVYSFAVSIRFLEPPGMTQEYPAGTLTLED